MAKRRQRRRSAKGTPVPQRRKAAGLPPGTPIYTGNLSDVGVTIEILDYDAGEVRELRPHDIETLAGFRGSPTVTWINVTGLHDVEAIQRVCRAFGVHPLTIEDIVSTGTRPKSEDYPDQTYIVAKMLHMGDADLEGTGVGTIVAEHTSLVLGPRYVLTFQERDGDVFGPVRRRIREGLGRLRTSGPDYLAYALLDAIVDNYFVVLDELRARAEALEDDLLDGTPDVELTRIYELRRELVFLRKQVWPLREAILGLNRAESSQITASTQPFLRDLNDHVHQVVEMVEMYRDMVMGMIDLQMNLVSTRMNEVMQTLTMIATIFIPLTFVVGVYGMNFEHMPELGWRLGYPLVWIIMILTSIAMIIWFRRRGWL